MASDGKVVISTALDNSGLPKGIEQAKGMLGGLGGVVKKLGSVIATAFSVKVVADFAKECLDLGSDLQEVQNVVDVTFTAMNEQVNEFAQNAAMTAGLSETMAKRYAGTFGAMAKSFKFTEAEAYEMSTALTQLSGDVASFYNLSQDAAYTKLKSVFTGETESLKDLGVVMTQTALDGFALRKGLGKTVQQMTEQEKVALRYQFVLDQLNGASGDFVRTQDSWANQTRILSLQFDQLKATLGQGFINVLTPVLKLINELIAKLQEFAATFKNVTMSLFGDASAGSSGGVAESLGTAAENAETLEGNITDAGKAAKKALAGFDELNVLQENSNNEKNSTSLSAEAAAVPTETTVEDVVQDNVSGKIKAIIDKILGYIAPLKEIDFTLVSESVGQLKGAFSNFGDILSEKISWAWENILVPLSKWTIEQVVPSVVGLLSSALEALGGVVELFWPALENLWKNFLKPIAGWTGKVIIGALDLLSDALSTFAGAIDTTSYDVEILTDSEKALMEEADDAAEAFQRLLDTTDDKEESISTEMGHISDLADELQTLADNSGKVLEKDQARAAFILGELNAALGTEYTMVDGVIQNYQNLQNTIADTIAIKKAQLLLDANTEAYKEALLEQQKMWDARELAEKDYVAQVEHSEAKILEIEQWKAAEIERIRKNESGLFIGDIQASIAAVEDRAEIEIAKAREAVEGKKAVLDDATADYEAYATTIINYDKASALVIQGNAEAAVALLQEKGAAQSEYADVTEGAASRETAALKQAAYDAGVAAEETKRNYENGVKGITKKMVTEMVEAYNVAFAAWANVDKDAEDLGFNFGDGFRKGLKNTTKSVIETASAIASSANKAIRRTAEIKSPSRVTTEDGEYMGEGLINGLQNMRKKMYQVAAEQVKTLLNIYASAGRISIPIISGHMTMPRIPYLATGAVLPANKPFLSVVGDQKHGTNIEAPLDTIKQALAEVMATQGAGDVNITFTGDLAQLARVLKPVIDRENRRVGGSLIKEGAF